MAKSSFSPFLIKLRQKVTKNDQKLIIKSGTKLGHNLTTKRGDSGSAGTPGEKCVIIGALNLDIKSDQKSSLAIKSDKNHQKSSKSKNTKIKKTEKVTKMRKVRK